MSPIYERSEGMCEHLQLVSQTIGCSAKSIGRSSNLRPATWKLLTRSTILLILLFTVSRIFVAQKWKKLCKKKFFDYYALNISRTKSFIGNEVKGPWKLYNFVSIPFFRIFTPSPLKMHSKISKIAKNWFFTIMSLMSVPRKILYDELKGPWRMYNFVPIRFLIIFTP